jgi:tetratricopeptide (TPR) repeat protein
MAVIRLFSSVFSCVHPWQKEVFMAKRNEPVRKSVKDVLDDLLAGHREAAFSGPESALKYLRRTFESQGSLPNAVKCAANDLMADAQAQVGAWEDCVASVKLSLGYLADLETAFPHEFRRMLEGLTVFERGIQAYSELGDFHAALELCERAMELDLGAHYSAKRDSLEWAR